MRTFAGENSQVFCFVTPCSLGLYPEGGGDTALLDNQKSTVHIFTSVKFSNLQPLVK
jgi:hypothetical protein